MQHHPPWPAGGVRHHTTHMDSFYGRTLPVLSENIRYTMLSVSYVGSRSSPSAWAVAHFVTHFVMDPAVLTLCLGCPSPPLSLCDGLHQLSTRLCAPHYLIHFLATSLTNYLTHHLTHSCLTHHLTHAHLTHGPCAPAKALDVMFLLHAEHEMNCSTAASRHLAGESFRTSTRPTLNLLLLHASV